ncbi:MULTISPECIES: acetamidase/formamidase family protein [Marivita]|uniref:Acetamidase/formamidase family protein n=1 Tax=Marivita cryptomonadis TaxID=505252 RepID=A0A9Q2NRH2_9RHOB|nr:MULTISPECIES: acetamidase/formamidase family protein [Marivita]MCR9167159.1 acetamidase/formamidase family protein [Paracoccaceae bacterium]MBM2320037.1 acetamidase/formamidase family protein [Marivita cryptomonadis]MBM2329616.1 acetamidase/formamidase family protein [Marivita cryptomonadis]MBM2339204.1 acetamidase/formamidase family protein [Marivita cryptomonadis]MBM2343862.1 acetamidase/formamidase family protein [Marivita cryptomonadis]
MIIEAGLQSCHWGYFDASLDPVATVASGSEVTMNSVSGGKAMLPGEGFHVPPELLALQAAGEPTAPGHILTGPVAVDGAMPGDVLQVDILDVQLRQDWGYNFIRPLSGTLPLDFDETHKVIIPLDRDRNEATMPWGLKLRLAPFFGVMAVAPPPAWGRISTIEPRAHGGNLDNKELVAGTTLYLPVHTEGALFSCGDGHGVQGDGEVCVTAIETALQGRFRLTTRRDLDITYPEAETPTHYITMGMHPDLDVCVEIALRRMISVVSQRVGITRAEAYMLCSLAGDLRITQSVNREKGVHMMMSKSHLA